MYVLSIVVCPFVLFLLAIVLSVHLRYTDSDYLPLVSLSSSFDFDIGFWNCFDSVVFLFFPIFIEVGEDNWNVCKTKADWASLAHRWHYTILAIMFKHFGLLASQKLLNDFVFQFVDIERTWWNFWSASCALNSTSILYPSNGAFEQKKMFRLRLLESWLGVPDLYP